jgi:hypothetical protein
MRWSKPIRKWVKNRLTRLGAMLSPRLIHTARGIVNYLEVGRWMHDHGFNVPVCVPDRRGLFEIVGREVVGRKVLCLEFGVYQGLSLKQWLTALDHAELQIHGFDSFEGLPETFSTHFAGKGYFSTEGALPDINDARVILHKGWFEDTVPSFHVPPHEVLVLNMDADLYSSTLFVLRKLRPYIVPGTYIHFDDFSAPMHEMRAFSDFLEETGLRFKVRGADPTLTFVLFQCVDTPAP